MSIADELFYKLNYKKYEDKNTILYQKIENNTRYEIMFKLENKTVSHRVLHYDIRKNLRKMETTLSADEIYAINEKFKEV